MKQQWFDSAIIYHIFAMSQANAPMQNEYLEAHNRLQTFYDFIPHIKKLGCDTVLFSPMLQSRSHGYDVTDYYLLDTRLGTNQQFAELVRAYHAQGIRVVLDSVFNHCGRDFFAFERLKNGDTSYADWFVNVDFGKQSPLGDSFSYEGWAGHYELVKFDLKNAKVAEYLLNACTMWIQELGIDGMRLDCADVLDMDFMHTLRQHTTRLKPDFWLMGEVVHGDYCRWVNDSTLHSVTNYALYKSLYSSHNSNNIYELANTLGRPPMQGKPLLSFLDNHDQPRIASIVDGKHLTSLYTLLYTLCGVPCIYYGSEWAIEGVKSNGSDAPLRPLIDLHNPPQGKQDLCQLLSQLADMRKQYKELVYGEYKQVYLQYQKPFVFERSLDGQRILVAVNIGDAEQDFALQGKYLDILTQQTKEGNACIAPNSVCVLKAL